MPGSKVTFWLLVNQFEVNKSAILQEWKLRIMGDNSYSEDRGLKLATEQINHYTVFCDTYIFDKFIAAVMHCT